MALEKSKHQINKNIYSRGLQHSTTNATKKIGSWNVISLQSEYKNNYMYVQI